MILVLAALLLGCKAAPECVDNGQCAVGQACMAEQCVNVECLDSTSCGLQQFCDKRDYVCKDGCETNDDCPAGDRCNKSRHECVEYGCRATDLDCGIGEVCDEDSGECRVASGMHCAPCDDPYTGSGCGANATCYNFDAEGLENYCVADCDPNVECPRGYECVDAAGTAAKECFAWCPTIAAMD